MTKAKDTNQFCEHLLREIPNTEENRDFWHGIAKQMQASDSKYTLRLRGRKPSIEKIMKVHGLTEEQAKDHRRHNNKYGSIPLDVATYFSLYLVTRKGFQRRERSYWFEGFERGKQSVLEDREATSGLTSALRQEIANLKERNQNQAQTIHDLRYLNRENHDQVIENMKFSAEKRETNLNNDIQELAAQVAELTSENMQLKHELVEFEQGKLRAEPIAENSVQAGSENSSSIIKYLEDRTEKLIIEKTDMQRQCNSKIMLNVSFEEEAVQDHLEATLSAEKSAALTPELLQKIGLWAIESDTIWNAFHAVLMDAYRFHTEGE